jgi:Ca2+-binding RTX toxin-like protein
MVSMTFRRVITQALISTLLALTAGAIGAVSATAGGSGCYRLYISSAGDAPNNAPNGDGTNVDNLDLIGGSVPAADGSSFTASVQLKDLQKSLPANGNSASWYFQWTYSGTNYWAGAKLTQGSTDVLYQVGTYDSSTDAYAPTSMTTGSFNTGSGGTVQVHVALADVGSPPQGASLTNTYATTWLGSAGILGPTATRIDRSPKSAGTYGTAFAAGDCPGQRKCTITGTPGADVLKGTDNSDVICAGAGNDFVSGMGGNDRLYGGPGNDKLYGQGGSDLLAPGKGDDVVDGGLGRNRVDYSDVTSSRLVTVDLTKHRATGGAGTDVLRKIRDVVGSSGKDLILGDGGGNSLSGGGGADTIRAGGGSDTLVGGGGKDNLYGEKGIDTVSYARGAAGANVSLSAGKGIQEGAGTDKLFGLENVIGSRLGDDLLAGSAGPNRLIGQAGDDSLYGLQGDDYLAGGAGDDTCVGGEGNDQRPGCEHGAS